MRKQTNKSKIKRIFNKKHEDRRKFALRLQVDASGSWCSITEDHSIRNENTSCQLEGLWALWEVAKEEGLKYDLKDEEAMDVLYGLVVGKIKTNSN